MKNKNKSFNQLLQLLKAYQERDEARDQLQKVLNKVMSSRLPKFLIGWPHIQQESPLIKPTKANSSITESNSLSKTYNYHSHCNDQHQIKQVVTRLTKLTKFDQI